MTPPDGEPERNAGREPETWGEYEWSEPADERASAEPGPEPQPAELTQPPEPGAVAPGPDAAYDADGQAPTAAEQAGHPAVTSPAGGPPVGEPAFRPTRPAEPVRGTGAPRVYRGELTSALGALALLVLMFATKWYGVAGVPDPSAARPAISTAENAWDGLTLVRWVMLACILTVLGSVVLHASQRAHGTRTDTSLVILGLGGLTFALLFYRVLLVLPQPDRVIDQKLGAVLGLACALAITLGGVESVHEQQRFQRDLARRPRRRRSVRPGREDRWPTVDDRDRVAAASSPTDRAGGTGRATPSPSPQILDRGGSLEHRQHHPR
ncbi:MAG TPA: hypothetical protein VFN55_06315 [Solirubrobacteraceae bacterium]|nr:hypothetical protein [Solirubrobacteraceae bacterium]